MRSLIAIAAMVASVSASAGELDGKTLVCGQSKKPRDLGIEFKEGRAVMSIIKTAGTAATISAYHDSKYEVTPEVVMFDLFRLYRDTLAMNLYSRYDWGEVLQAFECDVAGSPSEYSALLQSLKLSRQKDIDEEMKDNKI